MQSLINNGNNKLTPQEKRLLKTMLGETKNINLDLSKIKLTDGDMAKILRNIDELNSM